MKKNIFLLSVFILSLLLFKTSFATTTLISGEPINGSVSQGLWSHYQISNNGSTDAVINMTGLSNDVDLYVRKGGEPTGKLWDCRPYSDATSSEYCRLTISSSTTLYISVYGYTAANFTIKATLSGSNDNSSTQTLTSNQAVNSDISQGVWRHYQISNNGSTKATVDMTGLSNDVDLYVRKNEQPTGKLWDCRPYSDTTNSESCTLSISASTTLYISIYGYTAASFTIQATLSGSTETVPSAITRGADFFGTAERFNRYYTDPSYTSSKTIYVSSTGAGNGERVDPMSVDSAFTQIAAGTEVRFLAGEYNGCWGIDSESSGTYENPVVLKAEEGVTVNCCNTGRKSCFNLEFADYVAVDGFHLNGGDYGVRSVGGYATDEHQTGVAILNNHGENQNRDPFFTGGSDWAVVDNNIANNAGEGDGHGIYLSNGGDWMIVRNNELYNNASSDLQINADPISTCEEEGIDYDDPRCDGSATNGLGQGVSEFIVVENNYLHNSDVGPNFTSVRNSVFRNNIFGFYSRHNTSFWQETDNPNLGSSNNTIEHNLFVGVNNRHVLQFINNSVNNTVRNNVLLGVTLNGDAATANSSTLLIEQDDTTETTNTFAGNYLAGGRTENFIPSASDQLDNSFNTNWFANFPVTQVVAATGFKPTVNAPFLGISDLLATTPVDIAGTSRSEPTEPGPWKSDITDIPPVNPSVTAQFVTYSFDGSAWLAEAKQDGVITNLSTHLNTLDEGVDMWANISPDGEWLLLESERLHDDCNGWACLIYGKRDLSEFSVVLTGDGSVIHPQGFSAISNDGNLIVIHVSSDTRHDLMVSRRTGETWSTPVLLTANSPSNTNLYPTISADGQEILFHCGENLCMINADGSGVRTLLSLSDRPDGGSWEEIRSADFDAVSGDIVFEADDGSERIWRYNQTSGVISLINASHTNDNSSCVLPDGKIASLWLNRPDNSEGVHELKIMDSVGANHFLVLQDQDINDVGLGCGGR